MYFIALSEIADAVDNGIQIRQKFGGKALNLARLVKGGFNVPCGFVIPTSVFDDCMIRALRDHDDPDTALASVEFSDAFRDALREALDKTQATQWAVRSSSTDEDSQTHSFAGLQESIIGVNTLESCLEAIRAVWLSFYAKERLLYPSQASLSAPVPSMAVIIQACITPTSAGVVFTNHPISGAQNMLVNVSRGHGSNVVNGKTSESLNLTKTEHLDACHSECLTDTQLTRLRQTALKIEDYFGKPQDIEFAFERDELFLLQARDIVTSADEQILYSNVNVGEALSGVSTPMTWSVGMRIAERGFKTVFAMLGLAVPKDYAFVTTFYGHIYLNISQMLSVCSQIPFVDPKHFGKIAGIQNILEYACCIHPIGRSHFLRNLPHALVELAKLQSRMHKLPQKAADFERARDELIAVDLTHASRSEIQAAFKRLDDVFFECALDMLCAGGAFLASYVLCSGFIDQFSAENEELEQYLFSGLLDVQSAAPGLALLDIANTIRSFPELTAAWNAEDNFRDIDKFNQKISTLPGFDVFCSKLQAFLDQYGARAHQEAELANPRWREDRRFLYSVVQMHLRANALSDAKTAKEIAENVSSQRVEHTNRFKSMLSHGMRPIFRSLLNSAQKNARLREKWRAYIVDILGIFRQYFLAIGEQLQANGTLNARDDIFFLTYDEILSWLKDEHMLARARFTVFFRKLRHNAYQAAKTPPDTFVTHAKQCEIQSQINGRVLFGLPASPGCIKARVRVLRTLEDAAALEYGEIIAAPSTDVAWTPLFLIASAVLTERGGPLSHAFVVAREYGIPAVVSVPSLLDNLNTGDLLTVMGDKGKIIIENE
ncbi:MAG: hypothetical protein IKY83_10870 [Proteobacteria bacterium]|nr:hypothetical protein [Pseudomonadota bacterium]